MPPINQSRSVAANAACEYRSQLNRQERAAPMVFRWLQRLYEGWACALRQRRLRAPRPRRSDDPLDYAVPAIVQVLESRVLLSSVVVNPVVDGVATDTNRDGTFDTANSSLASLADRNFTFTI